MEETKKCKKNICLPWKTKVFLTITSFLPWKTTIKARNNSCLPWKKIKKELSSDAVEPSGGFFYPELRSTIVRVALPSFVLLVIKGLLKTYHREDLIAVLVDYQMLSIETDRQRFVLQNMSVGFC